MGLITCAFHCLRKVIYFWESVWVHVVPQFSHQELEVQSSSTCRYKEVLKPEVWLIYSLANLLWRGEAGFWCGSLCLSGAEVSLVTLAGVMWLGKENLKKKTNLKYQSVWVKLAEISKKCVVVRAVNKIILLLLPNINAWQIPTETNVLQDIIYEI